MVLNQVSKFITSWIETTRKTSQNNFAVIVISVVLFPTRDQKTTTFSWQQVSYYLLPTLISAVTSFMLFYKLNSSGQLLYLSIPFKSWATFSLISSAMLDSRSHKRLSLGTSFYAHDGRWCLQASSSSQATNKLTNAHTDFLSNTPGSLAGWLIGNEGLPMFYHFLPETNMPDAIYSKVDFIPHENAPLYVNFWKHVPVVDKVSTPCVRRVYMNGT